MAMLLLVEEKKNKTKFYDRLHCTFAQQGSYYVTFDKNVVNKHMDELILCANIFYTNWNVSIEGAPKYISTESFNPLRRVPIESKQKWLKEWTLMAVSCLFTAKSICCCQNLINMHHFSSLTRGAVTITSLSESEDVHHSYDITLVTPCPSLAAHGGGAPVLSATGETRPVTATGSETPTNGRETCYRPSVRPAPTNSWYI